jgi:hypothetical protein
MKRGKGVLNLLSYPLESTLGSWGLAGENESLSPVTIIQMSQSSSC